MESSLSLPAPRPGLCGPGHPLPAPRWSAGAPRTHPGRGASPSSQHRSVESGGEGAMATVPPPSSGSGGSTPMAKGPLAPPAPGAAAGNRSSACRASGPPQARVCRSHAAGSGRGREGSGAGITKPRARPGGDVLTKRPSHGGRKRGLCPRVQSSKTSTPPRLFPASRNSRRPLLGKLRP